MSKDIHQLLAGKWEDGTRPKDLYALYVSKTPQAYLDAVVRGLQSAQARVRDGCAEIASFLSEDNPALLYPFADLFLNNLDANEPIIRWEAVCTLGNLAAVDKQRKIPAAVKRITLNLRHKSIVLQVHSVRALSKIPRANPEKGAEILNAPSAQPMPSPATVSASSLRRWSTSWKPNRSLPECGHLSSRTRKAMSTSSRRKPRKC